MKLLPTPQSYIHCDEITALNGFCRVNCEVQQDATISWGLSQLQEKLTIPYENGGVLILAKKDDPFFAERNAAEQGYILIRDGKDVTIYAKQSAGFLYGLMTLRQLAGDAPAEIEIKDRPNVRFRGNGNTLWAETGVWSYDFGDGLEAACKRIRKAIDEAAYAKLNMMYIDAFGFKSGDARFPGYNETIRSLAEYARVRGVYFMTGGYGMGYGASAFGKNAFQGRVFRNRYPYPDGEIYDCIGHFLPATMKGIEDMKGRSYGTCLSNTALIEDKVSEMREYVRATGCRLIYFHNVDSEEIYPPLWLARCERCKEKYPNDDLFAKDGMAGAFADYYDCILEALKQECPDIILCSIAPGYGGENDENFLVYSKFWNDVKKYMKHGDAMVPSFREQLMQRDNSALRCDILNEAGPTYGCAFFSSGDGFYSDKIYTPSAAYTKLMHHCEVMYFANGNAIQKPIQYANAEYAWNPCASAYWDPEIPNTYAEQFDHYNKLKEGEIRPAGIYGEDGLLESSCQHLFGEKYAKRIADIFRIRGKNGECPIFTACNVELWSNCNKVNLPMLWDTPVEKEKQLQFRERFAESTLATYTAKEMLEEILQEEDLGEDTREHLTYLYDSAKFCLKLCSLLTRYMDLYIEADEVLASARTPHGDLFARCEALIRDADRLLNKVKAADLHPFDPMGGIHVRRDDMTDMVHYSTCQIVKSLRTGQRVPEDRRPRRETGWW